MNEALKKRDSTQLYNVGLFAYVLSMILESSNLRILDHINYDLFVYHGSSLKIVDFQEFKNKFRLGKLYF